ncbi:MAG: PhzF family phenazine biosynthesis isomerase [Geminicoccaceae bacterium]
MRCRFLILDVFTARPFGGNPLAVLPDAAGLSPATMQAVAAEFGFSETTFVTAAELPGHDCRVRIFTPRAEIPFAGHPTVGTAIALASLGRVRREGDAGRVVMQQAAGTVPVTVRFAGEVPVEAELTAPEAPSRGAAPSLAACAALVGLAPGDLVAGSLPRVASCGTPFLVAEVASLEALGRARSPAVDRAGMLGEAAANGILLVVRTGGNGVDLRARMFAPCTAFPRTRRRSAGGGPGGLPRRRGPGGRGLAALADRAGDRDGTAQPAAGQCQEGGRADGRGAGGGRRRAGGGGHPDGAGGDGGGTLMLPMDDRDGWIWLDGALVPWREARLHVLSHGLHYASAVFEGERAYGGKVVSLEAHGDRFVRSCAIMEMESPWDARALDRAVEQVIAANGFGDAYVRRVAWRGSEVLAIGAPANRTHVAVAAWPWAGTEGHKRTRDGIRVGVAAWRRPPPDCMPHEAKVSAAYAISTLSRHRAVRDGYDDALVLDWRGRIAETTGANLFLVQGDRLVTPTPDCFLDGITRRTVMRLAAARGIETVERAVTPDELQTFDGAFLAGTAAEIVPVRELAGHAYKVGPLAAWMVDAYAAFCRGASADAAAPVAAAA